MIRISTTLLESFRLYQSEDWMTWERLLESISGKVTPTPEMVRGSDFHAIVEDPSLHCAAKHTSENGNTFDVHSMARLLAHHQDGLAEVKETAVIETVHGPVTLVAKVDRIIGAELREIKTTEKPLDPGKYLDSVQWRAYLLLFGAKKITYDMVRLDADESGAWKVGDYDTLPLYPYRGLRDDVHRLVRELTDLLAVHGLDGHLKEAA